MVWVSVFVFLRGRSGEAGGAIGGLFWVELVDFVLVVLRVRGFLTLPLSWLVNSRKRRSKCVSSSSVRT